MGMPRCLIVAADERTLATLVCFAKTLRCEPLPISRIAQSYYHRRDPPEAMIIVEGMLIDGPAVRIADAWSCLTKPLTLIVPADRAIDLEYLQDSLEELETRALELARACESPQLAFDFHAVEAEQPYLIAAE